jgi:hypothetical protein
MVIHFKGPQMDRLIDEIDKLTPEQKSALLQTIEIATVARLLSDPTPQNDSSDRLLNVIWRLFDSLCNYQSARA